MRALERGRRRQTRKLSHEAHEVNARHLRDERLTFRHVANQSFDLICFAADVAAENSCGAGYGRMKTEQRVNQRRLAGAVRAKQTYCSTAQLAVQAFQNRTAAKIYIFVDEAAAT